VARALSVTAAATTLQPDEAGGPPVTKNPVGGLPATQLIFWVRLAHDPWACGVVVGDFLPEGWALAFCVDHSLPSNMLPELLAVGGLHGLECVLAATGAIRVSSV